MAEKNIKSRIVHKHDTAANWQQATGFTPMAGEIIVYDADTSYAYERIKIGDGQKNVNSLPFVAVQPNFSQNSTTAADYVQNRPFYDTIKTDLLYTSSSNQPRATTLNNGLYYGTTTGASTNLVVGSKYKITISINGYSSTIFTCTKAKQPSGYQYCKILGNAQLGVDAGFLDGNNSNYPIVDTGENFCFISYDNTAKNVIVSTVENARISAFYTVSGELKQLDEKYIPNTIARTSDVEAANIVYVGPDEPTDPNIKVWINTAEEGTGVVPVLPRMTIITLHANAWNGNSAPYSQTVHVNTVTSATKIDLQPTVSQVVSLQNDDIALMAENIDGVVTIYSFGGKPSSDMTMQAQLMEVSYV